MRNDFNGEEIEYYKNSEGVRSLMGKDRTLKKLFELLIGKTSIFYDRLESIGIQSFMIWNGYAMSVVGHTDMFAACDYSEADLAECPYRPLGRDIGEKHFRRQPLPDIRLSLSSLPLSYGDMC